LPRRSHPDCRAIKCEPIVIFEGKILDGRNRYKACELANVEPIYRPYFGDDPLEYVVSLNLHRRHLTTSQKAMVAVEITNLKQGGDRRSEDFKAQNCALISGPTTSERAMAAAEFCY
jgi:hypothetical protein